MKRMGRIMCVLTLVAVVSGMFMGCALKSKGNKLGREDNRDSGNQTQPASSIMVTEDATKKDGEKFIIVLFFGDSKTTNLKEEKRFVNKIETEDSLKLANLVISELFKGPISEDLVAPFPKGVKTPDVKLIGTTAVVNLSKEFVEKHPGGSTGELLTVYSIVNTLAAIEGIDQVQFNIDGKVAAEFKGHLEFDKPFKADLQLVVE
jgi:spore germination protein GerM